MRLRHGAGAALDCLVAAARFFGQHYLVVFAFGVGASVQRALSVRYGDSWPPAAGIVGEMFTLVVRLLFLVWVARALLREPGLTAHAGVRLASFARRSWPVLVWQVALLGVATLVFNVLLEGVPAAMLPESARPTFLAWLLAVKNVTVIPFTTVWLVTMVRAALRSVPDPVAAPVDRARASR